jgi:hypothetical protein
VTRKSWIGAAALFIILFGIYAATLNPVFRADDSPETVASCIGLGIQHPPSYPLFTLCGRLASLLPLGNPAWRLNLLAAFFGALAAALLCRIIEVWSKRLLAGLFGGLLLGLSPTFWSQCIAAKGGIYSFQILLLALLLLSLSLWAQDMESRLQRSQSSRLRLFQSPYFLLSAYVLALGFGNHWETQALFVPPALIWVFFWLRPLQLDSKLPSGRGLYQPLWKAALLVAAALSVYLLLPLRAALHPVMNWGVPDTWKQFTWVVFRQEYLDIEVGFVKAVKSAILGQGTWADVAANWPTVREQGLRVLSHLLYPCDLGFATAALAVIGLRLLWRQRRLKELGFCLSLLFFFSFVVTFYFQLKPEMIWIMDVFLLPAYFIEALLAGLAIAAILDRIPWQRAAALLLPLLAIALLAWRGPTIDQSQHFWAWDYGNNFLLSLKPNAIVFAEGDFNTMPVYYLQHVLGKRPDVCHITTIFESTEWGVLELERNHPELGIDITPHVDPSLKIGDGQLLRNVYMEIAAKNLGRRPLQASLFRDVQSHNLPNFEASFAPSGLSDELNGGQDAASWRRRMNLPEAMTMRYLPGEQSQFDPSPQFALSNYGSMYLVLANYARAHGRTAEAMPLYALAVEITTPPNRAEAFTHWGIALASQGKMDEAVEKFKDALQVKPLFEAYANLAGVMNQEKRYADAEPYARAAIAMVPDSGLSWNNLAISLYYRGHSAEAIQALETAARLSPQDTMIQNNLKALKGKT